MRSAYRVLYVLFIVALLALALPVSAWAAEGINTAAQPSAEAEILVALREDSRIPQRIAADVLGVRPVARLAGMQVFLLRVPAHRMAMALSDLQEDPAVVFVEPNGVMEGTWEPNDPYYNDPGKVYAPQQIRANLAWDVVRGSGNVVVAVVDSGVDFNHPDLVGTLWLNPREIAGNGLDDDGNGYVDDVDGWDFVNGDNLPADDLGHGTHVTGILAAATNNGIGIAGIAGGVKVLPVKVLNSNNRGTWADIAQGIVYAADMGVRAINLSLGATTSSLTVQEAVRYAQSKGVLVVAAAGNNGAEQLFYPAAYEGVVAVAGTAYGNTRWSLSNYGSFIDIAAPAGTVYSTYWQASTGSTYQFLSGTSMATPAVVGVAALLWSLNPALTASEVADILMQSAMDLGDPGWDIYYGHGQVDAYAAALQAQSTLPGRETLAGVVWMDLNGDGQRQPGETTGLPGVPVYLSSAQGAPLAQTTTDNSGAYAFTELKAGSYILQVRAPDGYINTTPTTRTVTVGQGQAAQADFGFVAPTALYVQYLDVKPGQGGLEVEWAVSGAVPELGWYVLRSEGDLTEARRISPEPILGVPAGADVVVYRFVDSQALSGHRYWYWVQNVTTGELFGPREGALRAAESGVTTTVFLPFAVS
jgi:subtilisin family serine protease